MVRISQTPEFTVSKDAYDYVTSLPPGFHYIACHTCGRIILMLAIPPVSPYTAQCLAKGIEIEDDPRFPGTLSSRCPGCGESIVFLTGYESDNPFLEWERG